MGVPGLWDVRSVYASLSLSLCSQSLKLLRPAGKRRSLTNLAVVDGFERNAKGLRGLRVGIDASIWFYHAAYGREGENPELRTLFFRCSRLLGIPLLPLFVFDGPKRPSIKRNKKISGKAHWLTEGMKNIIEAFGFEWHTVKRFLSCVARDKPAYHLGPR
jgi:Holliday junction resolvase YEN1